MRAYKEQKQKKIKTTIHSNKETYLNINKNLKINPEFISGINLLNSHKNLNRNCFF
jgi:predicted DNA-binding ArsR family transcriptional regulator